MSKPEPAVLITRRGAASWAQINRPQRANACGPEVMAALESWLSEAAGNPEIRALVLTGAGQVFCAGADMKHGATLIDDPEANLAFVQRGRDLVCALADAPVPLIAAVNGAAFAGGFEMVQAADIVISVSGARLGDRHVRHGIVPGWGSSARLPRLIGARAATLQLLTGIDQDAETLASLGLVTQVVEPDALQDTVDRLVAHLASLDPRAVSRILSLSRNSLRLSLSDALAAEWTVMREHALEPEFRTHVERFVES